MVHLIDFAFSLVHALIQLFIFAVIVSAILSWLVVFDVINMRNPFIYRVATALERLTEPAYRPFRRFIPSLGGIDITPVLVILVLSLVDSKLLAPLKFYLMSAVAG